MNFFKKVIIFTIVLIFVAAAVLGFFLFYSKTSTKAEYEVISLEISEGYNTQALAVKIGAALGWSPENERQFEEALLGIEWDAFNDSLLSLLSTTFNWQAEEKNIFLTHSSDFFALRPELFERVYLPGLYQFSSANSPAEVAAALVQRMTNLKEGLPHFLSQKLSKDSLNFLGDYVNEKMELLPDLIPLPPQDVGIKKEGKKVFLIFSTTYYNIGEGDLELKADDKDAKRAGDIPHVVNQKVMRRDGEIREYPTGIFEWHEEHLHYHFENFVEYHLSALDKTEENKILIGEKATFCLRDMTKIHLEEAEEETELSKAKYLICDKNRQGVSRGWGDTYFQTFAGQNFDITDIPSGEYRLSFFINPKHLFKEGSMDNNESGVLVKIDKENMTVEIIETYPKGTPTFEHIIK